MEIGEDRCQFKWKQLHTRIWTLDAGGEAAIEQAQFRRILRELLAVCHYSLVSSSERNSQRMDLAHRHQAIDEEISVQELPNKYLDFL